MNKHKTARKFVRIMKPTSTIIIFTTILGISMFFLFRDIAAWAFSSYLRKEVQAFRETRITPRTLNSEEVITAEIDRLSRFDLYSENSYFIDKSPSFVNVADRELIINPDLSDIGEYEFTVVSKDENTKYVYDISLSVTLPTVDFENLKTKVEQIVAEDNYAIYVYDLKREQGFDINGEEIFRPGSVSKLIYAVLSLRDVDDGKLNLNYISPTLIKMINHSRNDAMMEIDHMLGGYRIVDNRVVNELGIDNFFRLPHTCQANDIGKLLEGIYYQEYLSEEMSDYLIGLLVNNDGYDNRLLQGLPDDIPVAHKTGWIRTDYGEAYNDVAIVYGKQTDFVLVVLNKDTSRFKVIPKMKSIAELVYMTLDVGRREQRVNSKEVNSP